MPIPTPPQAALPRPDYDALTPPPPPKVIVIRWDSLLTALVALAVGVALGVGVQAGIYRTLEAERVSVPVCTHELADAGSICIGEPR